MTDEINPISTTTNGPIITSPVVMGGAAPAPVESPIVMVPDSAPDAPAADAAPDSVADPSKSGTTPEWAQRRINELTAKRYEAERLAKQETDARVAAEARAADLLKQITNKNPSPSPAPDPQPAVSDEEIERRVTERAAQMNAAARFNDACNSVADTGKKEFKDWDETLRNLTMVGAIGKDVSPDFLETAIELKDAHKILHYLGGNLEEAGKIAKMPPKKMALEMARIEASIHAPAPVPAPAPISSAPAPVVPITGAAKPGTPSIEDPSISTDDFMAIRAKQIEERRNRYRRT